MMEEKISHPNIKYAHEIKRLVGKYSDVIENSVDDVRPSNVKFDHGFELIFEKLIFQNLLYVPPSKLNFLSSRKLLTWTMRLISRQLF